MNKIITSFDERRNIIIPGNQEETIAFSISHFLELAQSAIKQKGVFTAALSGGSTPKAIFQGISKPENRKKVDWRKVLLFWSDERCVPKTDPESNYKMAMDAGLNNVGIPAENIFPMPSEGDLEKCAQEYEQWINKKVPQRSFDLVMLGMGEDGHTASLFPKTHGLHPTPRLVIPNFIPEKDVWRMTLTFDCINAGQHPTVYVLGKAKAQRVKEVLTGPYQPDLLPVQRVGTAARPALWILDDLASSELQIK